MTFAELIKILYSQINDKLPGEEAHELMAPYKRTSAKNIQKSNKEVKLSAVLMVLYPKNNIPHFALIQRPSYEGAHGGQISFPGGKQEKFESLKETALRETQEEIGIEPSSIQILGEITQVYIPPSNFLVAPFIGFLDSEPDFIPDTKEVEKVIEVNIMDLLNDELIKRKKIEVAKHTENPFYIDVPYFELNYSTVWGATAVMLSEVRQMLINGVEKSNRNI